MALQRFLDRARFAPEGQVHYSSLVVWPDYNERTLFIAGTFAGAVLTLEVSPDGANWFTYPLEGEREFIDTPTMLDDLHFQPGVILRLKLVGGTSKTDLSAWI